MSMYDSPLNCKKVHISNEPQNKAHLLSVIAENSHLRMRFQAHEKILVIISKI